MSKGDATLKKVCTRSSPEWGNILPVALSGAHQIVEIANTGTVADADISVKAAMLHLPDPR